MSHLLGRAARGLALAVLAAVCLPGGSLAGLNEWTGGEPDGGDVAALVRHPGSNALLAASLQMFKSTDGAGTWASVPGAPLFMDFLSAGPGGSLYAQGAGGTYFESNNVGTSWTERDPGLGVNIEQIVPDPTVASVLYIASTDGAFRSADGGASWTPINTGLPDPPPWIMSIAVDPSNPAWLFAGTRSNGLYRSLDAGTTWSEANTGLPDPTVRVLGIAIDPVAPDDVYVWIRFNGVYKSTDGGATWSEANNGIPGNSTLDSLVVSAADPSLLLASRFGAIYRSTDAGATWTTAAGVPLTWVRTLVADPADAGIAFAATAGGILESTDGGQSWASADSGLVAVHADELVTSPAGAPALHAVERGPGIFLSNDSGTSWSRLNDGLDQRVGDLGIAPTDPNRLYAATDADVYRSVNAGADWVPTISDPLVWGPFGAFPLAVAVDPTDPDRVYAGNFAQNFAPPAVPPAILESADAGANWSPFFTPDPSYVTYSVLSIAIDPSDAQRIFATGRGSGMTPPWTILRTTDRGVTWDETVSGPSGMAPRFVRIDPHQASTLYAGVFFLDGSGGDLFKSTDGGDTWSALGVPLPCLHDLAFHPETPDLLYAACEIVYTSSDGGLGWAPFPSTGLPPNPSPEEVRIHSLAMEPGAFPTLHAGTWAGVYSYTMFEAEIFSDGFESGDTSAWSGAVP